jgi:transcriptional regulator with XRE-family HTH domain
MKEQLQLLRKSKGLTQEEAANIFEVKLSTYQKYERDAISPPYDTLIKIADFYGVTTDYLLGRVPAETETLTASENALEQRLLEQYYKLPEKYRKKFLEGVIQAVELQKQQEAAEQNKLPHSATIGELLEAATENEAKNGA